MYQLNLTIYGRVQGVSFRSYTQKKAIELKLTGWVKNNADGSVEILVEGEKSALLHFLEWCNEGPSFASVLKIEKNWQEISNPSYSDFIIKY